MWYCTDTINFLRAGAILTSIDLSEESVKITKDRARIFGFDESCIRVANVEEITPDALGLSADEAQFDLIYSFGVIHHTPKPEVAIEKLAKHPVERCG